uniref:alpha/beta fold hydrolase n=1 Tax=Acetatifactor sp. TaxID=1872090 RepID=UPI0040572B50
MLYHAQNGTVNIGDSDIDYVSFGEGDKILIMLPGLGDAFRKVKGTALPFAMAYHKHAGNYKVYMFSRKNHLNEGYTTRDMARDQAKAMKALGIEHADIMGVSQGGMIAQYLAIDYPELVRKLVLVVTLSKQNTIIQEAVIKWIALAHEGNYRDIVIDTTEKSYSERTIEKYRAIYPLLGRFGKNKDFTRFLIQAHACLNHDSHEELSKIACPTLIVGGDHDQIVGPDSSPELAEAITGSELLIYEGLGHATYEEAEDFFEKVLAFLEKE